jgi:hypothetical protein
MSPVSLRGSACSASEVAVVQVSGTEATHVAHWCMPRERAPELQSSDSLEEWVFLSSPVVCHSFLLCSQGSYL